MALDDLLGDGQAETRTRFVAMNPPVHAPELLEDGPDLLGGNAITVVGDSPLHELWCPPGALQRRPRPLPRPPRDPPPPPDNHPAPE